MIRLLFARFLLLLRLLRRNRGYLNHLRVRQAQGQLISVNPDLHGIPQGSQLNQRHFRSGQHTHIQKMLPESAFSAHFLNLGRLARL